MSTFAGVFGKAKHLGAENGHCAYRSGEKIFDRFDDIFLLRDGRLEGETAARTTDAAPGDHSASSRCSPLQLRLNPFIVALGLASSRAKKKAVDRDGLVNGCFFFYNG